MITWHNDEPYIRFWNEGRTYHLDVRELLEQGGEPYAAIMSCVQQIAPDDVLVLHALFEPKPLLGVLQRMGMVTLAQRRDVEYWTVEIRRLP